MSLLEIICRNTFYVGLSAVNARKLVEQHVRVQGNVVSIMSKTYGITGRVVVFGFGKACLGMVRSNQSLEKRLRLFYGSRNNLPTKTVVDASDVMAKLASDLKSEDLLLVCITGGGSALLTSPKFFHADRLKLSDVIETIKLVSSAGAEITETNDCLKLNSVRRCLDSLKAGGLADLAYPAQVVGLIVSDVIGDPLDFIASGPTVIPSHEQRCSQVQDCLNVLTKYTLLERIPPVIKEFLEHKKHEPIPRDSRQHRVDNWILGNNLIALQAMADALKSSARTARPCAEVVQQDLPIKPSFETNQQLLVGYDLLPILVTNALQGCAEEQGRRLADLLWATGQHLDTLISSRHPPQSGSPHLERMLRLVAHLRASSEVGGDTAERIIQSCDHIATHRAVPTGICYLLSGEANVTTSTGGRECDSAESPRIGGGRCSHLGLSFALRCFEHTRGGDELAPGTAADALEIGLLAGASDGLDGPQARGGGVWVSGWPNPIIHEPAAWEAGKQALRLTDSYAFFNQYHPAWVLPTKSTDTNVMDLIIAAVLLTKTNEN